MSEHDTEINNVDQTDKNTISTDLLEPLIADLNSSALAIKDNSSAEGIHLIRVTLRKIRAWLGVCKKQLSEEQITDVKNNVRWISSMTGPARDADVHLAAHLNAEVVLPNATRLKLQKQQRDSYKKIVSELQSDRFTDFLSQLSGISAAIAENDTLSVDHIQDRINKLAKKSLKLGHDLNENSADEEFHVVRKSLKKLRYTLGFLMLVSPEKKLVKTEKSLKLIQEYLGDFQDQTVLAKELDLKASDLMKSEEQTPQDLFELGVSTGETRARIQRLKVGFPKEFGKFAKALVKNL